MVCISLKRAPVLAHTKKPGYARIHSVEPSQRSGPNNPTDHSCAIMAPTLSYRLMRTTEDDFFMNVAHALAGCQRVEQELKLYITEALNLAKTCIREKVPFKIRGEDYADSSLERLIDMFKRLSDDETLVADLQRFRDERNFLSHKAITHCLDGGGSFCLETAFDLQDRLESIQREAKRLSRAIFEKSAIIGFDDLTDGG